MKSALVAEISADKAKDRTTSVDSAIENLVSADVKSSSVASISADKALETALIAAEPPTDANTASIDVTSLLVATTSLDKSSEICSIIEAF